MLFINDIIQNVNSDFDNIFTIDELQIFILLYADDAVVFARSPEVLQSILNDIESYCTTWGLKINGRSYLQLTVNSQKTLKWLFTVNCQ